MNLLQLIQAGTGELGLSVPTYVIGNTASDVVQQLALMNSVVRKLQREHDWQRLIIEYRFNTQYSTLTGTLTDGSAVVTGLSSTSGLDATYQVLGAGINTDCYIQSVDSGTQVTLNQPATESGSQSLTFCKTKYTWPSDFDRMIDRTQWDKTKHWEMMGPETAQEWQWLKSGYIATGPRIRFRQLGGYFQLWPAVSANEYLGLEYVSKNGVIASGDVQPSKQQFSVDTDTCIWNDQLMIAGFKMAYFLAKGFDSAPYIADYQRELGIAKATEAGSRNLSFAPGYPGVLITPANIPDSGYGA